MQTGVANIVALREAREIGSLAGQQKKDGFLTKIKAKGGVLG
jgi:hypothetical protein